MRLCSGKVLCLSISGNWRVGAPITPVENTGSPSEKQPNSLLQPGRELLGGHRAAKYVAGRVHVHQHGTHGTHGTHGD